MRVYEVGKEPNTVECDGLVMDECNCKIAKPAKNFNELIGLVKQAEDVLVINGYEDIEDRISIIRGIYYGTEWSLDFKNEQSEMRNLAFNRPYTGSSVTADAREVLKCCTNCQGNIFNSLIDTYEVFDSKYKAVDFGHLIIGLDARRSWRAKNMKIATQGGTGLEINTWVGDLGGGVGKLSFDRIKQPLKRAKTLYPILGSSYGAMVNLEGDIAAYVCGMSIDNTSDIDDPSDNFDSIYESLEDYFNNKWDKRSEFFLRKLGGKIENQTLINKDEIVEYCADSLRGFAYWYLGLRLKEKGMGGCTNSHWHLVSLNLYQKKLLQYS